MFTRLINWVVTVPCTECGEVRVYFWLGCCAFCDDGEGQVH